MRIYRNEQRDRKLVTQSLLERERLLVRSCEIANRDPEVRAIEEEFDGIPDETPSKGGERRKSRTGRLCR